jgi:hypothetical protein
LAAVGEAYQLVIPLDDLHPVGLLSRSGVGVQRGDGRSMLTTWRAGGCEGEHGGSDIGARRVWQCGFSDLMSASTSLSAPRAVPRRTRNGS